MAIQYVVPQLRIFQEFAEVTPTSTASLGACMVGPYYKVRTKVSLGDYLPAGKESVYKDIDSTDIIDLSVVDSFKGYIQDALVERLSLLITGNVEVTGNQLVTNSLLADSDTIEVPYDLPAFQVGDVVRCVYSGGTTVDYFITSFGASVEGISATTAYKAPTGLSLAISAGGTTLTAPMSYKGVITSSFTAGNDTPGFYIQDNTGNIKYTYTDTGTTYTGLTIGDGVQISFTAGQTWWEGDTFTFSVIPALTQAAGGYNVAFLSDSPEVSDLDSVKLIRKEQIELKVVSGAPSATGEIGFKEGSIELPANLTYEGNSVLGGEIKATYKTLSTVYSDGVYSCKNISEATELLKDLTVNNPLGLMVAQALKNSNGHTVYFTGITEDSSDGYAKALALMEEDTRIYSIVPATTNTTILQEIASQIDYLSGAEVMNWVIGWFAYDIPQETMVESDITVTSTGGTDITIAPSTKTQSLRNGDRIDLGKAGRFKILTVDIFGGSIQVDSFIPTGTYSGIKVYRALSALDKTPLVQAAATSFNNYRIRLIVTPGITTGSDSPELISNIYMAAACAGYRSGVAPHQSLTRAEVSGFYIPSMGDLSTSYLNKMAESGAWLVIRDNVGNVFIRHQLTTDTKNYNVREDSKISNGDEIARYLKGQLESFYGRANISDEFIELLYLKLVSVPDTIRSRNYSSTLGPQITSAEVPVIERDPDLSDKLIIQVKYYTPNPANYIDLYLTIE